MLFRKMLREFKSNFGSFFSVFLLSALAMAMFCTFEGHVLSQYTARDKYHKQCVLSDIWMYGESFSKDNLDKVKALDFVNDAQLRTGVTASAPDCDGSQVELYLEDDNRINKPYHISGEEFNPDDADGVWLANAFASRRGINVGDKFTIEYNGVKFTRTVKGLIESAEYEYRQADGDADVYLQNIAIAYMSYNAFPVRDYINHMIEQEKITAQAIIDDNDDAQVKKQFEQLKNMGISTSDISKDMLLKMVENISDDKLMEMMPYTQMVITTNDGQSLSHEKAIADSINNEYSAMIDRSSVLGLARLDSELDQHQSFSYVFSVIFVGIAVLVIATTMGRMVEKQRTQIGTMNALGLKRRKIMLHYISFSLVVSVLGTVAGTLVGTFLGCPAIMNMFKEMYVVPGIESVFHPFYFVMALVIIVICARAAFLSCRKLLRIKPAQALRPAAPKSGKRCIFEGLPFWKKLSFNAQYNLRDISRSKLRSFMCVVGTAFGMLLMMYAVGCNVLVDSLMDINFNQAQVAQYQIKFSADAALSDVEKLAGDLDGELVMTDQVEVSTVANATSDQKKKEMITVVDGKHLYNILDLDNHATSLIPGTVAVSHKLAQDLNIKVGDTIYWHLYSKNEWYQAKVGMLYRSSETQGIAYLREDYDKTGAQYTPSLLATNSEDASNKTDLSYVTGVSSRSEMIEAYNKSMESISFMIGGMAVFSIIMIVVVLYNSGSLSFNERVKEFATLKVMGLRSSRIRRILSIQNLWLSVIGIIIGAPFGNVSLNVMMNSNGDNFDYYLELPAYCYIISCIFVLIVSMLVSFMFSERIKKLDMVEVLKGVE